MFNEGVDIPSVDMVMFLRPTQSPIIFLQQLGRGLRTYQGKKYLNVLDFIGNYVKAGKFISLLTDSTTESKRTYVYQEKDLPDDCILDFDMQLIDLFKQMDMKTLTMKEKINNEYFRIKELLEQRPTRVELFTYMEDSIYQYCMSHAKENPFRHYLDFLNDLNELSDDEKAVYKTIGRDFINLIETTDMQKVYKMPILYTFYNQGNIKSAITDEDVLSVWKEFFSKNKNWKDFASDMTYDKYLKITDKQHLAKAKIMPIKYLKASGKGFFVEKEGFALALNENLNDIIKNKVFVDNMRDVLEYRTIEYYRRRYNTRMNFLLYLYKKI
jgi:superfamily II DNA/RNA helicase